MRRLSAINADMERINTRYNPEHDIIKDAPVVTWADQELMYAIKTLIEHIEALEEKIKILECGR